MKINNKQEPCIILGKANGVSKKDNKPWFTLTIYIIDTEETVKLYVDTLADLNKYEKMKEYKIDLQHFHNITTGKLSTSIIKIKPQNG